jgi:hypothetical protein
MEKDSQMYVFALRPIYNEEKDGRFSKDVDIERMVPIDPYNTEDLSILSMMKLRASTQGDLKVYCIWIPKDAYTEKDLNNINDEEFTYLRKLIDQKKESI